ncbi:hypothetical protein ACWERW_10970 [Streptomyces sp. NPDC004012]
MHRTTALSLRGLAAAAKSTFVRLADLSRTRRAGPLVHGVKSLIAALITWGIAAAWIPGGRSSYLAVATALLMVNASTVYRSVTKAVQNVATRVVGLALAAGAAWLLGSTVGGIAVVVAVIAVVAGTRRDADDRLQVASNAVVALAATQAAPVGGVLFPAIQALTGSVVGIVVNACVLPPLYVDESDAAVRDLARAMGALLCEMGAGLAERQLAEKASSWLHQARDLVKRLVEAERQVQRADESLRWNALCIARGRQKGITYSEAFTALRGVSVQVRGIARTLADNAHDDHAEHHLGQRFLDRYAETLELAGQAVEGFVEPGPPTSSSQVAVRDRLRGAIDGALAWHETMTDLIGRGTLTKPGAWYVYGSLMTDVERLLFDLGGGATRSASLDSHAGL